MKNRKLFERFHWEDEAYAKAFDTLLGCSGERPFVHAYLENIMQAYPKQGCAVDWGAGSGDICRLLSMHFGTVFAVEPNAALRSCLAESCPNALILNGDLNSAVPPRAVDVGIISHVFYHIPDHKWAAYILKAANYLDDDGALVVFLKDANSDCNHMLEYFGAPRFDLIAALQAMMQKHTEYRYGLERLPGSFYTQSLQDTVDTARLVMCDRDEDAFSKPVYEQSFLDYVAANFWDDSAKRGGWDYDVLALCVRRRTVHHNGLSSTYGKREAVCE